MAKLFDVHDTIETTVKCYENAFIGDRSDVLLWLLEKDLSSCENDSFVHIFHLACVLGKWKQSK